MQACISAEEDLDSRASTLEYMLYLLIDDIQERLKEFRRERNRLAPVAKLPPELLIRIVEIAADGAEARSLFTLSRLRIVCSSWDEVIMETPSLWAHVTYNPMDPPRAVRSALQRSRDAPLRITCKADSPSRRYGLYLAHFVHEVGQHGQRWKWAEFCLDNRDSSAVTEITKVVSDTIPQIQHFRLSILSFENPSPTPTVDLFGGNASGLDELYLLGVNIPWTSPILSGLRVLTLYIPRLGPNNPTIDDVIQILSRSPDIEYLSLRFPAPGGADEHRFSADAGMTVLPALTKATLNFKAVASMRSFITRIHAPSCTSLTVTCSYQSIRSTTTIPLFHHFPAIVPLIEDSKPLLLAFSDAVNLIGRSCRNDTSFLYLFLTEVADLRVRAITSGQVLDRSWTA